MANPIKEELVPPMSTTDLTGIGTWVKKNIPGWDTEGYTNYKENMPDGKYPVSEKDWVSQTYDKKIADGHAEHLRQGGSLSIEDFKQGLNLNPLISNWDDDYVLNQRMTEAARVAANEKSVTSGGGRLNKGDFQKEIDAGRATVPGYKVEGDNTGFSSVQNSGVPLINEGIVPNSPQDNGLNDKSSLNTTTGAVTNANGDNVDIDPPAVLGIFDKASSLFGDVFSSQELKRMALYTVGGLVSGGSTSGSFKWAANQVMTEAAAAKTNAATINAARLKSKPVQIKVKGKNKPVQAIWDGRAYYDPMTGENIEDAQKWTTAHSPEGLAATFTGLVAGLKSGRLDAEGKPMKIGENGLNSYTKFRAKVAEWETQGYSPDLSSAVLQNSFVEAVKSSIAANKGKDFDTDDLTTPESFFDMLLVRGVVSSSAGSDSIFRDNKGNELSTDANNELMAIINNAVQTGQAAGYKSTVASATFNIHEAWKELSAEDKKQYNNSAEKGVSGFVLFAKSLI